MTQLGPACIVSRDDYAVPSPGDVTPGDVMPDDCARLACVGLWRSVGVATGDLNADARRVEVSEGRALFEGSIPDRVGVGDVLQYRVDDIWRSAFVCGRCSSTELLVQGPGGQPPVPAPAGTAVGIFRAYRSLADWQAQVGNPSLEPDLQVFDVSRNLVAGQHVMHVACYDDGPDVANVAISGWITSPAFYVHIFTPVAPDRVGVSQRHAGVYGGYRIEGLTTTRVLNTSVPHLRLEGLSIRNAAGAGIAVFVTLAGEEIDFRFEANIVDGNAGSDTNGLVHVQCFDDTATGVATIANNVVYDAPDPWSECIWVAKDDVVSALTAYVLNNSVTHCFRGIEARGTQGSVVAKNNVSLASTSPLDFYVNGTAAFSSDSSHNCSTDTTAETLGEAAITGIAAADHFVSPALDAMDLHALSMSTCVGLGANLTDLGIVTDIDGDPRPATGPWDIGADQL